MRFRWLALVSLLMVAVAGGVVTLTAHRHPVPPIAGKHPAPRTPLYGIVVSQGQGPSYSYNRVAGRVTDCTAFIPSGKRTIRRRCTRADLRALASFP
jgi:hypothetical protein